MRELVRCHNWFKGEFQVLHKNSSIGITDINLQMQNCFVFSFVPFLFFEQEEVNCLFIKQNHLHVYGLDSFVLLSFIYN